MSSLFEERVDEALQKIFREITDLTSVRMDEVVTRVAEELDESLSENQEKLVQKYIDQYLMDVPEPQLKRRKPSSSSSSVGRSTLDGKECVFLGRKRYVTISDFRNQRYIDVREYYDADGSWKPGKKGIALRKAEFLEIKVLSSKVIEAFSTCEEFSGNISSLRMLSVSPFQNRWFANIREFYDDNGSLKPGRKGITLQRDEFETLVDNFDEILNMYNS